MGKGGEVVAVAVGLIILVAAAVPVAASQAFPGCPERCGDLKISYPFGVGKGCYMEKKFNLTCNESTGQAYWGKSDINVTDILIDTGELRILQRVARDCYNETGHPEQTFQPRARLKIPRGFVVSQSRNKFFAVGCDTYAYVIGKTREGEKRTTGCMSLCDSANSVHVGLCSGTGCCEIDVPMQLDRRNVTLRSFDNHTNVWDFNRCSYAFTVEEGEFNFSGLSSFSYLESKKKLPLILDWSVGNQSCDKAILEPTTYRCMGNTKCDESKTGIGYLCNCLPGYEGNPYHPHGCQDIDECELERNCKHGKCTNKPGNFSCICDKGFTLNKNRTVCEKDTSGPHQKAVICIVSGVSGGVVALVCASLLLCLVYKKRKLFRQKERFFEQNGGLLLQRRLCNTHDKKGSFDQTAKIYTEEELKKATDNYSQILGEGGYGVVYKGILPDERVVAIKKSKIGINTQTQEQTEQFINEIILLMQINHKNVVRLLGCCLDTEVPILVYEFITSGTLFERIHKKGLPEESPLSWDLRLKIATDTAGALSYLHSETNTPILHRDIKSMNILLDENYNAKVADFGTSRLVPTDQEELSTLVQGTIGYLDPEYLQSSQLTDKSDVYSFGVVLAELLTGNKALSFNKSKGITINLATVFISLKEDEQFCGVIDEEIDYEVNAEAIREVVRLTKRCLRMKGEERPTMKEVAMELEGLRAMSKHVWGKVELSNEEENEYLLGSSSHDAIYTRGYDIETGSSVASSSLYDSIQNQPILRSYKDGR